MVTTIIAIKILGKDIKRSTNAIIHLSTLPPIYPATSPKVVPTSTDKKTTEIPIKIEYRAPLIIRTKKFLPKSSVPKIKLKFPCEKGGVSNKSL